MLSICSASWIESICYCCSLTPNNRSLSFLQTGPGELVQLHIPKSRGAVSSVSIASTDLLSHVETLPMDQLILHDTQTVYSWPNNARSELFAVARRDIAVARRNLTSLMRYVDMHEAHLAACDGGLDDRIPLMTVEMFPRATGGIQSALDVADRRGCCNSEWEFRFVRTGQKVRTVCLPARSTLILTICLCPWRA